MYISKKTYIILSRYIHDSYTSINSCHLQRVHKQLEVVVFVVVEVELGRNNLNKRHLRDIYQASMNKMFCCLG